MHALLVGDFNRAEFREAYASIASVLEILELSDVSEARLASGRADFPVPDLVILAQSYPGQFSAAQIDVIQRRWPLVRIFQLLGSWCEGEARTGRVIPAVTRVYWYDWAPRWQREWERLGRAHCPIWGQPLTAAGLNHGGHSAEEADRPRGGLVVICTNDRDMADILVHGCARCGYGAIWMRRSALAATRIEGAVAAIWVGGQLDARELAELNHWTTTLNRVPVLAVLDFPRVDCWQDAASAGVKRVISKPFLLGDVFRRLDEVAQPVGASHQASRDLQQRS